MRPKQQSTPGAKRIGRPPKQSTAAAAAAEPAAAHYVGAPGGYQYATAREVEHRVAARVVKRRRPPSSSGTELSAQARNAKPLQWMDDIIAALSQIGELNTACKQARVSPDAVTLRRAADPAFEQRVQQALADYWGVFRAVVLTRARDGVREPVWSRDKDGNPIKVDEIRRFPGERIAQLALAGKFPNEFGRQAVDITSNGQTIQGPAVTAAQVIIQIPSNGREPASIPNSASMSASIDSKSASIPASIDVPASVSHEVPQEPESPAVAPQSAKP